MPDDSQLASDSVADDVERAVQNVASLDDFDEDLAGEADATQTDEESAFAPDLEETEAAEATDAVSPLAAAGNAARGAQQSIKAGITAFRDVRAASRMHSSARDELRSMQETLEGHEDELRHRIDIEQRYDQIVAEQTAERDEASRLGAEALQRSETLEDERANLESQLSIMKTRHEDELRPYRNLAESTKGRADDAARALADAKRQAKSAEGALSEATRRRDQRISSANHAVDNAQERLRKLQDEFAALSNDPAASADAVTRLENEIASETSHLASAQADVASVTDEMRLSVENAQTRLFDVRQALSQAESIAESAKKEAADRRAEYDNMFKQAQEEERALSDEIRQHTAAAEQARAERSDAEARANAAQELLDEAQQIHDTPEVTVALNEQIAQERQELDNQQTQVDDLAATERELRKGTFKQRLTLVLAGVGILAVIIAIVVAVVMARGKANSAAETEAPVAAQPTVAESDDDITRPGADETDKADDDADDKDEADTDADDKDTADADEKDADDADDKGASTQPTTKN